MLVPSQGRLWLSAISLCAITPRYVLSQTTAATPVHESGAGAMSLPINERVVAVLFHEHSHAATAIAAVVYWRGRPGWFLVAPHPPFSSSLAELAAPLSSLSPAVVAAGGAAGRTRWTAAYDPISRMLWVGNQAFSRGQSDSVLVVLVDRTDGVGGSPKLLGHLLRGHSNVIDVANHSETEGAISDSVRSSLTSLLRGVPVARNFLP